jgi:hypothetical protein
MLSPSSSPAYGDPPICRFDPLHIALFFICIRPGRSRDHRPFPPSALGLPHPARTTGRRSLIFPFWASNWTLARRVPRQRLTLF